MNLEYVKDLIKSKDYDEKDLVAKIMHKLSEDLEFLSENRLPKEYLIDKLVKNIDIIRFGDFKENDPECLKENDKDKLKVHNFHKKDIDGKVYKGIRIKDMDLKDSVNIEHTLTHELIHTLHKVYDEHGRIVQNGLISVSKNGEISGTDINEGTTEYITRLVMEKRGVNGYPKDRYFAGGVISEKIFGKQKIADSLAEFIGNPKEMIKRMENTRILGNGKNFYEFVNDYLKTGRNPTNEELQDFEKYLQGYEQNLKSKNYDNTKNVKNQKENDREEI